MYEITILQLTTVVGDWTISTHTPHGNVPNAQKHVHIKKRGLKGEYSWNKDGTRHDDHRFPSSEQMVGRAKDLAANALGVPSGLLKLIVNVHGEHDVKIRIYNNPWRRDITTFVTRVESDEFIAIFEHERATVVIKMTEA
jgi:hypothetical protein